MPGKNCAVQSCNNNSIKTREFKERKVYYHMFPKDPLVCKVWIQRCRRLKVFNPLTSCICSDHFKLNDYRRDLQSELLGTPPKKILKPEAVPSLNLGRDEFLTDGANSTSDMVQKTLFDEAFETVDSMAGDRTVWLQSDTKENEDSYRLELVIDSSDPLADQNDDHSIIQSTSSQTSVIIKKELPEEKTEEYLFPEFGSEIFYQSEISNIQNEKVENNKVIKFTIHQLSGNQKGCNRTKPIKDVINQIEEVRTFHLQESCRAGQKRCGTEQESSKAEQESCKAEQESCGTEQESSKAKKGSCKANKEGCKANQESCKADQESCKTNQESCKTNQESCKTNQESCKAEQKSCKPRQLSSREKRELRRKQKTDQTPVIEDDLISRLKEPIVSHPILAYVLLSPFNKEGKNRQEDNQLEKANSTACSSTTSLECESNSLTSENCQRLPQTTATSGTQKRKKSKMLKDDPAYAALLASAAVYDEPDESAQTTDSLKTYDGDGIGTDNTSNDAESTTNPSKSDDSRKSTNHSLVKKRRANKPLYYRCAVCSKKVERASKFLDHTRMHTGEKPFVCKICGRAFRTSAPLKRHQLVHTGERPHLCPTCGKTFAKGDNLLVHMNRHTEFKPYECNICKKRFYLKYSMTAHLDTHGGNKPYGCSICKKRFGAKTTLAKHMITHNRTKAFECAECGKRFTLKSQMVTHMKVHRK